MSDGTMAANVSVDPKVELAALLEQTLRIQALIEQGDWVAAAQLDAERQARLHAVCAALDPSACPPDLLGALVEIVKLNDRSIGAIEHQQRMLLRDADMLSDTIRMMALSGASSGSTPRVSNGSRRATPSDCGERGEQRARGISGLKRARGRSARETDLSPPPQAGGRSAPGALASPAGVQPLLRE